MDKYCINTIFTNYLFVLPIEDSLVDMDWKVS